MSQQLVSILDSLKNCKILVIGDLILDQYAFGSVSRISPEAPIQIFDFDHDEYRLGGAANVAHNLVVLHAQVGLIGLVGADDKASILTSLASQRGIHTNYIFSDSTRPTTIKTRFICQGHHLLRADHEKRDPISPQLCTKILDSIQDSIEQYDIVVMSDYAKGLLADPTFCEQIITLCNKKGKKVMIGPKGTNWKKYSNAYMLSANRSEAEAVSGFSLKDKKNISIAGHNLLEKMELQGMLITLGSEGMYLVIRNEQDFYLPANAKEVFDVVGAGDTVLAIASLVLGSGYSWQTAITLANTAAGIVVRKVGVGTVTPEELIQETIVLESEKKQAKNTINI